MTVDAAAAVPRWPRRPDGDAARATCARRALIVLWFFHGTPLTAPSPVVAPERRLDAGATEVAVSGSGSARSALSTASSSCRKSSPRRIVMTGTARVPGAVARIGRPSGCSWSPPPRWACAEQPTAGHRVSSDTVNLRLRSEERRRPKSRSGRTGQRPAAYPEGREKGHLGRCPARDSSVRSPPHVSPVGTREQTMVVVGSVASASSEVDAKAQWWPRSSVYETVGDRPVSPVESC